jgi:hypothetical protein
MPRSRGIRIFRQLTVTCAGLPQASCAPSTSGFWQGSDRRRFRAFDPGRLPCPLPSASSGREPAEQAVRRDPRGQRNRLSCELDDDRHPGSIGTHTASPSSMSTGSHAGSLGTASSGLGLSSTGTTDPGRLQLGRLYDTIPPVSSPANMGWAPAGEPAPAPEHLISPTPPRWKMPRRE